MCKHSYYHLWEVGELEIELSVSPVDSFSPSDRELLLRKSDPSCLLERWIRLPLLVECRRRRPSEEMLEPEDEDRRMDSTASVEVYVSSCPAMTRRRRSSIIILLSSTIFSSRCRASSFRESSVMAADATSEDESSDGFPSSDIGSILMLLVLL